MGKETWQMTRKEFIKQDLERYRKDAKDIGFSLNEQLQAKLSGEQHEKTVRKALSIGKPIPSEVLKDYPDLARKAEPLFGEIDTGVQKGLFGEERPVTVMGKGKPVQASLEAWGKLERLRKEEKEQTIADYDRAFTLSELQKMCREKGLSTSGDKKALIIRIVALLYQKGEIEIKLERR